MILSGESPSASEQKAASKQKANSIKLPPIDPKTNSYIPPSSPSKSKDSIADTLLPPISVSSRTEFKYAEVANTAQLIERLQTEQLKFMIQRNFYVLVKIVKCMAEMFSLCLSSFTK